MASKFRTVFVGAWVALGVSLAGSGETHAQGKPVDPFTLDVASVRLGMSVKDAVAAIKQHFHANDKQISLVTLPSRLRPGKTIVAGVNYLENGVQVLSVSFSDRVPLDDARPEYATTIEYKVNTLSPDNAKQLRQATLEKYGPPTFVDQTAPDEEWCAKVQPASFGNKAGCQPLAQPALVLDYMELKLVDGSYYEKVQAAVEQTNRTGKPNL